jgi:copper chaperone
MTTLIVEGMTCGHCKAAVERALTGVEGVTHVDVDLEKGRASIEGGALDALVAAVSDEGYAARQA